MNNIQQIKLISPTELKALLSQGVDIQLIDVRVPEKHEAFNVGGKNIPLEDLPNHLNELNKSALTVTYCTMGNRSMRALEYLEHVGFSSVKSLDGGVTAWQKEG